eukprot:5975028-Prymnesium_polylepis.1
MSQGLSRAGKSNNLAPMAMQHGAMQARAAAATARESSHRRPPPHRNDESPKRRAPPKHDASPAGVCALMRRVRVRASARPR